MRQNKFSNCRDWRAFLSAAQVPPGYTNVATALKAGHDWLTGHAWRPNKAGREGAFIANGCWEARAGLISGTGKTLGM